MRAIPILFVLLASNVFAQEQPLPPPDLSQPVEVTMEPLHEVTEGGGEETLEPYSFVEQMPEYPGGQQAMMQYMVKHLRYAEDCIENGIEGKVFVGFVVDKEGVVNEVKVLRGVSGCPQMDKESVRVVQGMPNWTPGKQNGEPVSVRMTIPVVFKLD